MAPHQAIEMKTEEIKTCLRAWLESWNQATGSGLVLVGQRFLLTGGAVQFADLAWLRSGIRRVVAKPSGPEFLAICPEFVLRICDLNNRPSAYYTEMEEWIDGGAQAAWLFHEGNTIIHVFCSATRQATYFLGDVIPSTTGLPDLDTSKVFPNGK